MCTITLSELIKICAYTLTHWTCGSGNLILSIDTYVCVATEHNTIETPIPLVCC